MPRGPTVVWIFPPGHVIVALRTSGDGLSTWTAPLHERRGGRLPGFVVSLAATKPNSGMVSSRGALVAC